jgi:hypothetical protein
MANVLEREVSGKPPELARTGNDRLARMREKIRTPFVLVSYPTMCSLCCGR